MVTDIGLRAKPALDMTIKAINLNGEFTMKNLRIVAALLLMCVATTFAAGQLVTDKPPQELTLDCGKGQVLKLISIPAGEFMMGSPATLPAQALSTRAGFQLGYYQAATPPGEQPQHKVRITKPFFMGLCTVTQAQYEAVMGVNPSRYQGATRPVEMVSWKDAADFCAKLSAKTGRQVRLPTEAEWEYTCRAGTTGPWYTSETLSNKVANFRDYWGWAESEVYHGTTPVGSYPPNPWGLYDMLGNVQQWCQDWYDGGYYRVSPVDDPPGPDKGAVHVARGGAWDGTVGDCRSAVRIDSIEAALERDWTRGFRVVCVCTPEEINTLPKPAELEAFNRVQVAALVVSALLPPPAVKSPSAGTGPAPATKVPETLTQRLDGAYYHRASWKPAKSPERLTPEKRKVTVLTPGGKAEKEIAYYKNALGMELVLVPAGEFLMGTAEDFFTGCAAYTSWHPSPDKYAVFADEKPQHKVRITKPFYMGSTEVTYEQYVAVMGPHKTMFRSMFGRKYIENRDFTKPPASELTWYDAAEFCKRLSAMTGRQVRLPTEAEWEYACRAGTTTPFYTGDRLDHTQASIWPDWTDEDGIKDVPPEKAGSYIHPVSVGSFPANPWGLYDMHGLFWEWCQDWYDPNYYKVSPVNDPTGPTGPVPDECRIMRKVLRGGSWDGYPAETRSAIRLESREPAGMAQNWGFRIVIECTPQEIKAAKAAATVPK